MPITVELSVLPGMTKILISKNQVLRRIFVKQIKNSEKDGRVATHCQVI